jgi:transcriptional regulator with XRE-family HTH domain
MMTKERLNFILNACFESKRGRPHSVLEAHLKDVAANLGISEVTLRRWRTGQAEIPRSIELLMEVFHNYPQVTADALNNIIRTRDNDSSKT